MNHANRKSVYGLGQFFGAYSKLIAQRPRLFIAVIFLSFAAAGAEGLGLAIIYPILDNVLGTGHLQGPLWDVLQRLALGLSSSSVTEGLLLLAIIIFLAKAVLLGVNVLATTLWINRLQEDWRLAALSHYLFGPHRVIIGERRGTIIQNVLGETSVASSGLQQLLALVTKGAFAIALIATLFLLNWKLTLALLVVVTFLTMVVRPYALKPMQRLGKKRMRTKQLMSAVTAEPIFAASTIKLLGLESHVLDRLDRSQRKQTRVNVLMALFTKAPNNFTEFVVVASVAVIFLVLARGFGMPYQESAPLIGAFAIVSSRLLNVLSGLFYMRLNLATVVPSVVLVERLVNSHLTAEVLRRGATLRKIENDIQFCSVSFGFSEDKPIFSDLSIVFPEGKMTGIVGATGVGKSTIAHLIVRLYEPTSGKILINGRDIREFSLHSLRRRIGFVEQTPALFNGTIGENISVGAPGVTMEQIEEAAEAAGLKEFIMSLPEGCNTVVQDQGSTLSGGERQRIAIARAVVRRPDLYIFDEGTSALDRKTEAVVQQSIQRLAREATVIVIAHRVSTLKDADLIYEVLPDGGIMIRSYQEIAA